MPKVVRKDVQTNTEIMINYEVIGNGAEALVLHHGNGNCIRDWHTLEYVPLLKNNYKLILIDSRGYGQSSKPHDPIEYSLKSRAEDTISVLDHEKIEKAHCLGASIGAAMCFVLARFYPDRFRSYIFATPYFALFKEEMKKALAISIEEYVRELEGLIGNRISNENIRNTFLANDAKSVFAANSSEWFNYLDFVQYVKTPTLIYVGAKETTVKNLQDLSIKLEESSGHQSHFHVFSDADHAKIYWSGDLVVPVIRKFIDSISNHSICGL